MLVLTVGTILINEWKFYNGIFWGQSRTTVVRRIFSATTLFSTADRRGLNVHSHIILKNYYPHPLPYIYIYTMYYTYVFSVVL